MAVAAAPVLAACSSNDETFVVEAGGSTLPPAGDVVDDMFSGDYYRTAIIKGTEQHLVHATNETGVMDLYTFEGDFPDRGHVLCWVDSRLSTEGGGGAGAGCAESLNPEPHTTGSAGSSSEGSDAQHTSTLLWAPADAVWFRAEVSNGDRLTANVVNQASIVAWEGGPNEYVKRVSALDEGFNELWSKDLDKPPPGPALTGVNDAVRAAVEAEDD